MSISVSNLSFAYERNKDVLHCISFDIPDSSFVCLLGPNGVGKSTLFRCMLGLTKGWRGHIDIEGHDASHMSARDLSRLVAYIPQSHGAVFNYTVSEIVLMGTTAQTSMFSSPGRAAQAEADSALELMGIEHLRNRDFMRISGGERQLVLIARALAQKAHILFMDEPTANLDYGNQVRVLRQARRLTRNGYTIIQSTHNPDQAFMYADYVLAVQNGRVEAFGQPQEVMDAELMHKLYNVDLKIASLYDDRLRVCVPNDIADSTL